MGQDKDYTLSTIWVKFKAEKAKGRKIVSRQGFTQISAMTLK